MINLNGINKTGYDTAATRKTTGKSVGTPGKKDEKKDKNTDKTEFSSFTENNKGIGGLRVGAASQKTSGLSKKAEAYLEKLKKKYGNMDFIIADYSTDEEADKLLAKGKGEYNVLITPDLLEKMAEDEDTAAEYEGMIDQSVESIDNMKNELGDDADMVDKFGISFDANGNMTIRAKLAGDLTANDGTNTVKASTVEDMLAQLKEAKESQAEKLEKIREERRAKEEETAVSTDDVDKEVEKLRNDKKDLLAQIRAEQNTDKRSELEEMLKQLDSELAQKGTESYRRRKAQLDVTA